MTTRSMENLMFTILPPFCKRSTTLLIDLLGKPGLELGPLLTSELNLAIEVIREDDLFRVREVDRRATTLDATQLDHAHFGRTMRCHNDIPFFSSSKEPSFS